MLSTASTMYMLWNVRPTKRFAMIARLREGSLQAVNRRGSGRLLLAPRGRLCDSIDMSGKDIEKAFRSASRHAGDKAISDGHTVVVKRGRQIVGLTRDGKQQVVHSLDKAYVRSHAKTYKVK